MKKKFACLLALVMMLSCVMGLFTGCSEESKGLKVVLQVNEQQDAFFKQFFKDMEEEFGVTIEYKGYTYNDYPQMIKAELQDSPPDIFYVCPSDLKEMVGSNLLADLSGYLASEEFAQDVDLSKIYPSALDMYRYNGKNVGVSDENAPIYGINLGFSYQGLGYNKKLVERKATEIKAAGLPLPWELGENESYTFEEFSQLLGIVKDTTGGGLNGTDKIMAMNLPNEIMPLIWSFGGDIINGDTVTADSEPVKKALAWLEANYKNGNLEKAATWGEWSTDQVVFFTEIGSWEVAGYVESEFDFDMMPWPSVNGDANWYGQIGTSAFGVYKNSKNVELATKIAACFFREDVQDKLVKQGLSLPMYIATAEGGYLTDDETYKPEHREIFINVVSGRNGKNAPIENTYNSEWYDKFKNSIHAYLDGSEGTMDEYLSKTQSLMQQLIDKYKK